MKGDFLNALIGKDLSGYRFEMWRIVSAAKGKKDVQIACRSYESGAAVKTDLESRGYKNPSIFEFPVLTNGEDIYIAQTLEKVELEGTDLVSKGNKIDFFIPRCFDMEAIME